MSPALGGRFFTTEGSPKGRLRKAYQENILHFAHISIGHALCTDEQKWGSCLVGFNPVVKGLANGWVGTFVWRKRGSLCPTDTTLSWPHSRVAILQYIVVVVQLLSCVSLQPHGMQHARLPCPSPSPRVCSNSCPLSWWCHPTLLSNPLILCHPLFLLLSIFSSIRVFSKELALLIRWPKNWSFSFSISSSNEYSGLISFRMDWIVLAVQGTLKSLLQHHS